MIYMILQISLFFFSLFLFFFSLFLLMHICGITKKNMKNFQEFFSSPKKNFFLYLQKIKCYLRSYMSKTTVFWGPIWVFWKTDSVFMFVFEKIPHFHDFHEIRKNAHFVNPWNIQKRKSSERKNFFSRFFF